MSGAGWLQETTFVCWSERQVARARGAGFVGLHVQGDGDKTLCGIETDRLWGFNMHDYPPAEFNGCKRCKAVIAAAHKE